jgi:cell fate regulator YaaT (PSP1 superfamily)
LAEVLVPDKILEKEEFAGNALRRAAAADHERLLNNKKQEKEYFLEIKREIKEAALPMKLVEVVLDIEGGCLVLVFTAEGRIDFRDLVKKLSGQYQKSVRFQQIGSRDEARRIGGYGICGKQFCCQKFPGMLKSISTDMARDQLISCRGSDRISGACGRLMCCLSFEAKQYQELLKESAQKGEVVKYKKEDAEVLDINPVSGRVRLRLLEKGGVVEVLTSEIKRKN